MIQIKNIESLELLNELKQQYMEQTTSPLDGMWMVGFVPMANHYGFYDNGKIIGFFCINEDGYLLQFHVVPEKQNMASVLFNSVLTPKDLSVDNIKGAFASTAEPHYLSLCLDNFPQVKAHTLMYKAIKEEKKVEQAKIQMEIVQPAQLEEAVEFAKTAIGAPEEWLTGYFSNLINREELHGYRKAGSLVATGECRGFDQYQTEYADLGFIVGQSERGEGLGTKIFKYLVTLAETKGLKPICSTEITNIGAQKAISRAGLFAGNRIIKFDV